MKDIHLTDDLLQAILLEETRDAQLHAHLSTCVVCRKKLEAYQLVMNEVEQMTPESFSFDVTAVVMDTVTRYEKKRSKRQAAMLWGLVISSFIAIALLSLPFLPTLLSIFASTNGFTTVLLIGTGFMVFVLLLIDMKRHFSAKEARIMNQHVQPIH